MTFDVATLLEFLTIAIAVTFGLIVFFGAMAIIMAVIDFIKMINDQDND